MTQDDFVPVSPEEGFLDVAANALAVILFVTMLLLLTVSASTSGRSIPEHDRTVTIPEPKLSVLSPIRLYYVISERGITYIDLSPFHIGFFAGERKVTSDIGQATLTVDRPGQSGRDMNAFSSSVRFNPAGIAKLAQPLGTQADVNAAFDAIQQQLLTSQAGTLTAIIAPGGASNFVALFQRLDDADIPFRMAPMPANWELDFRRKAVDFNSRLRER